MLLKDMDKFVVLVKTEEEFEKAIIKMSKVFNRKFNMKGNYKEAAHSLWCMYKENTCIHCSINERHLTYASLEFFQNNSVYGKILEFNEFYDGGKKISFEDYKNGNQYV